jgi:hypothetical protein
MMTLDEEDCTTCFAGLPNLRQLSLPSLDHYKYDPSSSSSSSSLLDQWLRWLPTLIHLETINRVDHDDASVMIALSNALHTLPSLTHINRQPRDQWFASVKVR